MSKGACTLLFVFSSILMQRVYASDRYDSEVRCSSREQVIARVGKDLYASFPHVYAAAQAEVQADHRKIKASADFARRLQAQHLTYAMQLVLYMAQNQSEGALTALIDLVGMLAIHEEIKDGAMINLFVATFNALAENRALSAFSHLLPPAKPLVPSHDHAFVPIFTLEC